MAYLFPPEWTEWRFLPWWSRKLGDIFCVFVWGQWNIVVKDTERVKKVILEGDLTEGWPYKAPATALLGKTCPAILHQEEAGCLRSMISGPLSHASVLKQAPQFAELAQSCIEEVLAGHFEDGEKSSQKEKVKKTPSDCDAELVNTSRSFNSDNSEALCDIDLKALRSYTLDLMHGPVLSLDREYHQLLSGPSRRPTSSTADSAKDDTDEGENDEDDDTPSREMLLLWMDRLKDGLCDVHFTYGPEWMQIWRLNPYGRALNARVHLEELLSKHIEEREQYVPVRHEKGFATRDPFVSAIPLWTLTGDYFFRNEHPVMGFRKNMKKHEGANRLRARSENDLSQTELPLVEDPPAKTRTFHRLRSHSDPDLKPTDNEQSERSRSRKMTQSVLDQILRASDVEGQGITRVATTEITLLLWMMMDAGQAWTSMALHLLSKHEEACFEVQAEIDRLDRKYKDRLFTSFVLEKMEKLDNLIHEAIRFTPTFMGGLKTVNATVEMDGVQIPKHSSIFLSNPNDPESFNIDFDTHKRPEELGSEYPSLDLFGFLPLQGLEIPIMVLQTKIFLIVLLRDYTPIAPGRPKSNFIQRVSQKIRNMRTMSSGDLALAWFPRSKSADDLDRMEKGSSCASSTPITQNTESMPEPTTPVVQTVAERIRKDIDDRNEEGLFTRVPFPVPRRPVQIRPRVEAELFPSLLSPLATPSKPRQAARYRTE